MSIEEHATMKYFYNAEKKNQSPTLLQVPVFSMQALTIINAGHCF